MQKEGVPNHDHAQNITAAECLTVCRQGKTPDTVARLPLLLLLVTDHLDTRGGGVSVWCAP